MIGNFQDGTVPGKMQYGPAWWFLDQADGMTAQMNALSNMGLLSRFVGMVTDSRSFLSYSRHEYFRRLVCNLLGEDVRRGLLPDDRAALSAMVEGICFFNARDYFGFPLGRAAAGVARAERVAGHDERYAISIAAAAVGRPRVGAARRARTGRRRRGRGSRASRTSRSTSTTSRRRAPTIGTSSGSKNAAAEERRRQPRPDILQDQRAAVHRAVSGAREGGDRFAHYASKSRTWRRMRVYLKSRGVAVPEKVNVGRVGNTSFTVKDPDGHIRRVPSYGADGLMGKARGTACPPAASPRR